MNLADLLSAAKEARQRAYAPYSGFKVGCSINDENGKMFTGCNVENASYGLSLCAERVAVFKAVSEGAGKLMQIAVVADTDVLTPPCGACRQILWEFASNAELILENLKGKREVMTVRELLPRPFDASFL
jgi:cytidine deaminase